jgi:hypothetical protein
MDSILLLKKQTGFTGSFWIHPVYPVNPVKNIFIKESNSCENSETEGK